MTLNQLRTFLAVAAAGSVRGAAEELVVSQPAVSGAVSSLAKELGVELFEPDGRGLRITAAGVAFADAARASLGELDRGVRVARSVEAPGRGSVCITSIATAAERLVLPLLATFRREQPEAGVTVRVENRVAAWATLRDHEADLVVAGRPPSWLDAVVLGRASNTLVVVGLPAQAGRPRRQTLAALAASTWLLREEGSGTRDATEELLAKLALDPPRMILGSNGAVEEAVVAGFGVALLPQAAAARRLDAGTLARIDCPGTPLDRPWHLVASADVDLSPTARLAAGSLLAAPGGFKPTPDGRRLVRRFETQHDRAR